MVLLGTYHVLTSVTELGAGFPLGKSFRLRMKLSLRPPCIQRPQGHCYYNLLYYCSFLKLIKSQPEYAFMYLILKTFTCHVLNILTGLIQVLNWEEHFVHCVLHSTCYLLAWMNINKLILFHCWRNEITFWCFSAFRSMMQLFFIQRNCLLYFCNKVRLCSGELDLYLFLVMIHSSLSKPIMMKNMFSYSFLV